MRVSIRGLGRYAGVNQATLRGWRDAGLLSGKKTGAAGGKEPNFEYDELTVTLIRFCAFLRKELRVPLDGTRKMLLSLRKWQEERKPDQEVILAWPDDESIGFVKVFPCSRKMIQGAMDYIQAVELGKPVPINVLSFDKVHQDTLARLDKGDDSVALTAFAGLRELRRAA